MQGGEKQQAYESRRKQKEARIVIVSELYSKGKSFREIRSEVIRRLDLGSYSLKTVHDDIETLLKQWRSERLDKTDQAVTLFLERNRQHYEEARLEWDRSRKDRYRTDTKRKGVPIGKKGGKGDTDNPADIITVMREEKKIQELGEGDPRYMELMIKCEEQRAKLLGLYAPEKKELTGPKGAPLSSNEGMTREEIEKELEKIRKARND